MQQGRPGEGLFSTTPIDPETETALLTAYLTAMQKELPATDPVLKQALAGRTPDAAAKEMVSASAIVTGDQRKALGDGGASAAAASADPFIALARVIDPLERAMTKEVVTPSTTGRLRTTSASLGLSSPFTGKACRRTPPSACGSPTAR
jgi:hypothetical protein